MASESCSAPAPMRDALLDRSDARTVRAGGDSDRPSCCRRTCACLGAFLLDFVTVLFLLVASPLLLCIIGPLVLAPLLDRLFHPRREYLDGVSAAFANLCPDAVIHGLFISEEPVKAETVFGKFREAYLAPESTVFARFRQRFVVRGCLWPYWKDAEVDAAHHFRTVKEAIGQQELQAALARHQSKELDPERPPWEMWHYENYTDENGKPCSATLLRIHHSVADGCTLMRVLMQAATPNKPPEGVVDSRADRRRRPNCCQLLRYWLTAMRKLVFMGDDKPSTFKSSSYIHVEDPKAVAWNTVSCASVADLKVIGKGLGGATINDILLAALTGAMRRYAETTQGGGLANDITTCSWVSLCPLKHIYTELSERPLKWGNSTLGCVYLKFPLGERHRELKAQETLHHMQNMTKDPALMVEAKTAVDFLSFFGWLPKAFAKVIFTPLTNTASLSMSNVPGPQFALEWCGLPVRGMLFFMPPSGTISMFATIATWNGKINVGLGVDGSLISQEGLQSICGEFFEAELQQLRQKVADHV